jgi:hypothetical protein
MNGTNNLWEEGFVEDRFNFENLVRTIEDNDEFEYNPYYEQDIKRLSKMERDME